MRAVLRIAVGLVLMIVVASTDARAQSRAVWGYAFLGPGVYREEGATITSVERDFITPRTWEPYTVTNSTVEWGGGVEWAIVPSFGVNGELRAMHLSYAPEYPGGIASLNGSYHFRPPQGGKRTWSPFVTAGYSVGPDRQPGFNFGGGTNVWSRGATGLRLEVRSTALKAWGIPGQFAPTDWSVAFRAGLNFGRKTF